MLHDIRRPKATWPFPLALLALLAQTQKGIMSNKSNPPSDPHWYLGIYAHFIRPCCSYAKKKKSRTLRTSKSLQQGNRSKRVKAETTSFMFNGHSGAWLPLLAHAVGSGSPTSFDLIPHS